MECLDHPNIVRLFEVVENFQKLHLIMECASEGDLHARVTKAGPFSEEDGRRVFAQVVAAINHMVRSKVPVISKGKGRENLPSVWNCSLVPRLYSCARTQTNQKVH